MNRGIDHLAQWSEQAARLGNKAEGQHQNKLQITRARCQSLCRNLSQALLITQEATSSEKRLMTLLDASACLAQKEQVR